MNFLERFSKNTQIPNFMKIRPVGVMMSYTDRQTDRHDETSSRFSQICNRTQNIILPGGELLTYQIRYLAWYGV